MDFDTSKDGYYIIRPEDYILSECMFVPWKFELGLGSLQALVGGYIECVRLKNADGIVDEEGKLKGKRYNSLATALYGRSDDEIAGTMVVLCGKARLT